MIRDYAGEIYDRVWMLLEADADFAATFKPANRIKLRQVTAGAVSTGGVANPFKQTAIDADYPQCTLYPTLAAFDGFTTADRYVYRPDTSGNQGPTPQAGTAVLRVTLAAEMIFRDLMFFQASQAMGYVWRGLYAGGPRLGLDSVKTWKLEGEVTGQNVPQKQNNADVDVTPRTVSVQRITAEVWVQGADLFTPKALIVGVQRTATGAYTWTANMPIVDFGGDADGLIVNGVGASAINLPDPASGSLQFTSLHPGDTSTGPVAWNASNVCGLVALNGGDTVSLIQTGFTL